MKDNKKYFEVFVNERDQNKKLIGKRKRGISTEREAKQIEFQLKTELKDLTSRTPVWTWENWTTEVLRRVKIKFKNATHLSYESYIKNWVPDSWSKLKITEIQSDEIYKVIEASNVKLSPISQHTFLKILKRIFQEAVECGYLNHNPAKGIVIRTPESSKKVLTTSEVETLLVTAKNVNHRFYPVWCFAVKTGMRSGEMYALLWSDVDFERSLISVTKQWTRKDGTSPTKSRENRVIPISQDLEEFLLELKKSNSDNEYVLPRLIEWTHGDQSKVIREFCRASGVTEIKFHDLRATFITNMLSQGVPLVKVMSIVGHKKMETTDIYLRLAGVDIKGATDALSYSVPKASDSENVIKIQFGQKTR